MMILIFFKIAFAPSQQPWKESSCLSPAWFAPRCTFMHFSEHITSPALTGVSSSSVAAGACGAPQGGSCRAAVEPAQPQPGAQHSSPWHTVPTRLMLPEFWQLDLNTATSQPALLVKKRPQSALNSLTIALCPDPFS